MSQQWHAGEFVPAYGAAVGTGEPASKSWPMPEQRIDDPFWTATVARPASGDCPDYLLAGRQSLWDEAETKRVERERLMAQDRAEREKDDRARKSAEDAALVAKQEAIAARREEELRGAFLAAGGSEATWLEERGEILKEDRKRQAFTGASAPQSLISPAQMVHG
jgi:hypothetical protein